MILPESLHHIGSSFDNFRKLAQVADAYLNENVTNRERESRLVEISDILQDEGQIFVGNQVVMSGILKKAQFTTRIQPALEGTRHLEETKVVGRASGFVVADLETDYDDVKDKSPRQEKLYRTLRERALGRYGVGYLVDIGEKPMRARDFLLRGKTARSALGLVLSSSITLDAFDPAMDLFNISPSEEVEVLRILDLSSPDTQKIVHFVGDQLLDSEDKLATLARHAKKLKSIIRPENHVELRAIGDYFACLVAEDFFGKTFSLDGVLPIALQEEDDGTTSFCDLEGPNGCNLFIGGLSVADDYEISEDRTSASFLSRPALFLLAHEVQDGQLDSTVTLIPLEKLDQVKFTEVEQPDLTGIKIAEL